MSIQTDSTLPSPSSANSWTSAFRRAATARNARCAPIDAARAQAFLAWVERGGFIADRERVDLQRTWRYLRPIYEAVPAPPDGLDLTIMKPAQAGASIFGMLFALWLTLQGYVGGYFLPVATTALYFSQHRFLKLVRENVAIHRLMGDPATRGAHARVDEGSASVRTIGDGRLYFTYMGGKITTEALALDFLVLDEVQSMLLRDIQKVAERVSGSTLKATVRASTANFAGADIAYFFERSTQHEWYTRCGGCADGVVLTDHWDPKLGPSCIDVGNGTTPGVHREPFYVCPRCGTIIADPQDGRFVARAPQNAPRLGFHWGQMLSPRQTAASILEKWRTRTDTAHFYRRVLGMPYADPATQPVTEAMLVAAQNPELRWGPPARGDVDGVYMGLDQMGGDIHAVIVGRAHGKQRLLHLEIIQSDDPFRRAAALMSEYRVRYCAVENLPNFNEAHRFAKAFPGRVFVVHYRDHAEDMLTWGDRPGEKLTTRESGDEVKTTYTASVDQYKMMSLALSRWAQREVETPDPRTLVQRLRTDEGERPVQVCNDPKLGFWLHLQRVALEPELPEGRDDERRPRAVVKKIGIDPHFAFAWMLLQIAWARAHGTTFMLSVEDEPKSNPLVTRPPPARADGYAEQIRDAFPGAFQSEPKGKLTCADCLYFQRGRSFCKMRRLSVLPTMPACFAFDGACTGSCRTPIPGQAEHPFRRKPNTDSGPFEQPDGLTDGGAPPGR